MGKLSVITCLDITYIRANGSYCQLHTKDQQMRFISKNLGVLCGEMDYPFMLRVSQSNLVNLFYVKDILLKEKQLELIDGVKLGYTISIKNLQNKIKALYS